MEKKLQYWSVWVDCSKGISSLFAVVVPRKEGKGSILFPFSGKLIVWVQCIYTVREFLCINKIKCGVDVINVPVLTVQSDVGID